MKLLLLLCAAIVRSDNSFEPWSNGNKEVGDCFQPTGLNIVCCPQAMKDALNLAKTAMKRLGKPSEDESLEEYATRLNNKMNSNYPVSVRQAGPTYTLRLDNDKACGIQKEFGNFEVNFDNEELKQYISSQTRIL
ncbi:unnamed protein product [Bursaphelenchus okinawaensis]|uniref:Uncharacterized protein n=1 Tax=Bursaphelenchus okinawaensis TaxID=465554 RepID=A0A811KV34_9BILA|nr:unnamed protein product [Bursaphelenchus okinawaensis]CAG9112019.1 unnamed protein product [Bursaphelenchus okinawaensis]